MPDSSSIRPIRESTCRRLVLLSERIVHPARALALAAMITLALFGQAQAGEVLRIAHPFTLKSNLDNWVIEFAEIASKEGAIEFQMYFGGELGSATDLLKSVQLGVIDLTLLPAEVVSTAIPEYQVLSLPGLYSTVESRETIISQGKLIEALTEQGREQGLVPLSLGWTSWTVVSRNTPIKTPKDLFGRRVRTFSKGTQDIARESGAVSVKLKFKEIPTAMETGYVDVVFTNSSGWDQMAKVGAINHITWSSDFSLYNAGYVLVANAQAWNRLGPDQQEVLIQAGITAGQTFRQREVNMETKAIHSAKLRGVNITELSENSQGRWRDIAAGASWSDFMNSVQHGKEMLDIVKAAEK